MLETCNEEVCVSCSGVKRMLLCTGLALVVGACFHDLDDDPPDAAAPDAGGDGPVVDDPAPDRARPDLPGKDLPTPDQPTPDLPVAKDLPAKDAPVTAKDQGAKDQGAPDKGSLDKGSPDTQLFDSGGKCTAGKAWCVINTACYKDKTVHPADNCRRCEAAKSTSAWTPFSGKGCVTTLYKRPFGNKTTKSGSLATADLNQLRGMAFYNGSLYVTDHAQLVRRIDLAKETVTTIGGTHNVKDLNGFYYPTGIVVDKAGLVFVADKNNHKIRTITGATSTAPIVGWFAGSGAIGHDDGAFKTAKLSYPSFLALDSGGNILVTGGVKNSTTGVVRMLVRQAGHAQKGKVVTLATFAACNHGTVGVAVSQAQKKAYATCNNSSSATVWGLNLKSLTTLPLPSSAMTKLKGGFGYPEGLLVTTSGKLYAPGLSTTAGRHIYTWSAAAGWTAVVGNGAMGTVDGAASSASVAWVYDVAVDPKTGWIYFGDSLSSQGILRVYSP